MALPVTVSRVQHRRGTQDEFDGLYPPGYIGTGLTVSERAAWPNILASGEVGLCTDTRRVFIGGINGQYIEFSSAQVVPTPTPTPTIESSLTLLPISVILPPKATYTVIPALSYNLTSFFSFLYSLTDTAGTDWNAVGTSFAKNGVLQVTAVSGSSPTATLNDTGTVINSTPHDISFIATYNTNTSKIDISYIHDFSTSLLFSTGAVNWVQI